MAQLEAALTAGAPTASARRLQQLEMQLAEMKRQHDIEVQSLSEQLDMCKARLRSAKAASSRATSGHETESVMS